MFSLLWEDFLQVVLWRNHLIGSTATGALLPLPGLLNPAKQTPNQLPHHKLLLVVLPYTRASFFIFPVPKGLPSIYTLPASFRYLLPPLLPPTVCHSPLLCIFQLQSVRHHPHPPCSFLLKSFCSPGYHCFSSDSQPLLLFQSCSLQSS